MIQGELEGNFIRGSHYPQDPRFLDRCDELGVLVWEEALAWGNSAQLLNLSSAFMAAELGSLLCPPFSLSLCENLVRLVQWAEHGCVILEVGWGRI